MLTVYELGVDELLQICDVLRKRADDDRFTYTRNDRWPAQRFRELAHSLNELAMFKTDGGALTVYGEALIVVRHNVEATAAG